MGLIVKDLKVNLEGQEILKGIDLTLKKGSFLSLLGPSGCGKTTLLKALGGLIEPLEGEIILQDERITYRPAHKRDCVIVFQDLRLFPHLSVEDNIGYGLKLRGVGKKNRREEASKLLKLVGLEGFEKRSVGELSGGEKQRVALMRALAIRPKLLLLDEPFSALDKNIREEAKDLVLRLHREFHLTTVLVTHDQEEALALSDEVAVMFKGEIHQQGSPEAIYNHPKTEEVAHYFGQKAMTEGFSRKGRFTSRDLQLTGVKGEGEVRLLIPVSSLNLTPGDFEVEVEMVQFQGENYLLGLKKGALTWKKECNHRPPFKVGEKVSITLDRDKLILYEVNHD